MPTTTFTARRSWSSVDPATRVATVTVYDAQGAVVATAGGARAARAQAAIVARHDGYRGRDQLHIYGLRADAAAAATEAHKLATATTMRHRGGTYPTDPWTVAVAVPVVDEDDLATAAIQRVLDAHQPGQCAGAVGA